MTTFQTYLSFVLLLAAQRFVERLLQKSEQFFPGTEIKPLAGINFFRRSFEPA